MVRATRRIRTTPRAVIRKASAARRISAFDGMVEGGNGIPSRAAGGGADTRSRTTVEHSQGRRE